MELRPYQNQAVEAIQRNWSEGNRRTLLVLPTGTGKTIVFCKLAEECVRLGKRVLILAHRGELLDQAADKMQQSTGLACAIEKAEFCCLDAWERIVVGSVQTMMSEKRLRKFPDDYFDVIIVDEAHHVLADSYQRILEHFGGALVLGVTATADRGDRQNLGKYFDSIAYEYTLPRAIEEKFLAPIRALTIPLKLDLSSVRITAGDLNREAIGNALDPYLDQIANEIIEHCSDRKTVVFLPLIATGQKFCAILKEKGIRAAEINGESRDRKEILADFDAGEYDVLCNAMLLTEGWDCPSVDCIVVLRPTKIRSLYAQMVGRGTRIHPGKDNLLLLDFLWHCKQHALIRPAHLICSDDTVAAKMTEIIADDAGAEMDLDEIKDQAESDIVEEREAALANLLRANREKEKKLVDPLRFERSIGAEDLIDYQPFGQAAEPPTAAQLDALNKAGVRATGIESRGQADMLLQRIRHRRQAGLATPKQVCLLKSKGFRDVDKWSMPDASKMITRIAAAGWRVPAGVSPKTYKPEPERAL